MKKLLSILVSALLLAALFTGCAQTSDTSEPSASASAAAPSDSAPDTSEPPAEIDQTRPIVFAASRDQCPGEEDAHYASMRLGVWEPLLATDEDGNPSPALAESWEANDDFTIWTFHLREGVSFSNGVPFNADAVLANFDRYAKGPFSSSFYGINIDTTYPGLQSVDKLDDYTVQLTFESSLPTLDFTMTNYGSSMFEPSCFNEDGTFNSFAIGTGPYVVTENVLGEYCTIERNDNYWGAPGIAETLKFVVIPDADTRYSALKAGEVQGLCDLGAITPSLAAELEDDADYNVSIGDSGITHFLNVNGVRFPFDDVRMREGLSLLLNREEIIDSFYNGYGLPAGGFLNYTSAFYKEMAPKEDVERGKELISEVIGDTDVTLEFLLPTVDANRYPYQEEAEYIQAILLELGIKSNITLMEWGPCKEVMAAGNYDMCLKIQGLPSAEPFSLFKGFMYSDGSTNKNYGLGYKNDHVDELIDSVANELNIDTRRTVYDELQEISVTDFPNIALFYSQEIVASSAGITGYQATVYGLTGYTEVCWAK